VPGSTRTSSQQPSVDRPTVTKRIATAGVAILVAATGCSASRTAAEAPSPSPPAPSLSTSVPEAAPIVEPPSPSPKPPPPPVPALRWTPSPTPRRSAAATLGPNAGITLTGGITAIGDSVMLDAAPNLRSLLPGITIDAVVSRGVDAGIAGVRSLAGAGQLGSSVVVHLGTNGTFTPAEMDQLVAAAGGRRLVLLTNHCPYCSWTPSNNAVIEAGCTPARRCSVADWNGLAGANPQWFGRDGVHMPIGGTGGQAYAELVVQHL
jgi:hypothetical protein